MRGNSAYLIRLQAAGHAVLVRATAAIGQAAVTAVLLCAGDIDVTAAIHQQILPFTNVSWKSETKPSISQQSPHFSPGVITKQQVKHHVQRHRERASLAWGTPSTAEAAMRHSGNRACFPMWSFRGNVDLHMVNRLHVLIYLTPPFLDCWHVFDLIIMSSHTCVFLSSVAEEKWHSFSNKNLKMRKTRAYIPKTEILLD